MIKEFLRILAIVTAALAHAGAVDVQAQTQVDLQLVLAVDASGSVSQARFDLQKQGYANAFRNPRVLRAIRSGPTGSIAVTMFQWTGPDMQVHAVPWMVIKDAASAEAFAKAIEQAPRQLFGGGTSISGAIDYGAALMNDAPFKGLKQTIDISGDGSNNRGRSPALARDDAVKTGIVINGLPILSLEPWLDKYFFDHVIGGPG